MIAIDQVLLGLTKDAGAGEADKALRKIDGFKAHIAALKKAHAKKEEAGQVEHNAADIRNQVCCSSLPTLQTSS